MAHWQTRPSRILFALLLTYLVPNSLVHGREARAAEPEVTLYVFSSPGCGPCRQMQPAIQQLHDAGYAIRHIDISREDRVAEQFGVESVPHYITVANGRGIRQTSGVMPVEHLQRMIADSVALVRRASGPTAAVDSQTQNRRPAALASQRDNRLQYDARGQSPESYSLDEQSMPGPIAEINPPNMEPTYSPNRGATPPSRAYAQQPRNSHAPRETAPDADRLIAATVRLKVIDRQGHSTGTGTLVDSREGSALVLTCGHIFKDSQGQGPIEVTMFLAGPNGAVAQQTVTGTLEDFDLDRDLALVSIRPTGTIQVAPIAPPSVRPTEGSPVITVGCNAGDNPTAVATKISALNRFLGHPNLEAAGQPVEGRSGGGMFNTAGQLVGVCYAADPEADEGLYVALDSIYAKLDSLNLAMIYQAPAATVAIGSQAMAAAPPGIIPTAEPALSKQPFSSLAPAPAVRMASAATTIRGQNWPTSRTPATGIAQESRLNHEERAAIEEIKRRGAKSEVIFIIRPQTPQGKSDVITFGNASPAFVEALTKEATR